MEQVGKKLRGDNITQIYVEITINLVCIFQNRKLVLQPCSWKIWTICIRFIREMSLSKRHHYQSGYHFLILSIYYKPTLGSCLTAFISKALLTIFFHSPHYHLPPSMSSLVYLIFHTFSHPISVFFLQHMPIPSQPVLLYYQYYIIFLSTPYLELYLLP